MNNSTVTPIDNGFPKHARGLRMDVAIWSDSLPGLIESLRKLPALAPLLGDVIQVRLVVDANIVQGELRWRLRRRRKPLARSALHEAIVSGVLVAFAPNFLVSEIEEHAEGIADDTGCSVADVRREWQDFRQLLLFYTPRTQTASTSQAADPDDLQYVAACTELGALAVYSKDRHLREMNCPVICVAIDTTLRAYARATTVRVTVMLGSTFVLTLSLDAIAAACRLVKRGFERVHPAVQIAIVGAIIVAVAHPRSRAKLISARQSIERLAQPILAIAGEWAKSVKKAETAQEDLRRKLPAPHKRSLLVCARAICLIAKQPLPLAEIERRIRADGYISRARDFRSYLRRVLRSNGQFIEVRTGVWAIDAR